MKPLRFPLQLLLPLALFGMIPVVSSAQALWTLDGSGRLSTEAKPAPQWQSGRILLDDRLDGLLQLRQNSERATVDYNLGGFLEYTSEGELTGDLTQLNARIALGGFPGPSGFFSVGAGRIGVTDPSHYVINQPGDGLSLALTLPGFEAGLSAAYFGLLLKHTNEARFLPADIAALSDRAIILAPPRGAGMITLGFPSLLFDTDLTLWGIYFADFADPASVRRWYGGLSEGGPIWGPLSQKVVLIGGAEIAGNPSLLGSLGIGVDISRSAGMRALLEATYASGDGGGLSAFLPLTGSTNGVVLAVPYQNVAILHLEYSILPLRNSSPSWLQSLETFVEGSSYFKPEATPVTNAGYDPPGAYYGTEVEGGVRYQRGTDPAFSISGGFFADAGGTLQWFGHLLFSVSF